MENAISTCMKKYADFSGRATRSEFWYFYLFYMLIYVAIAVIDRLSGSLVVSFLMSLVPLAFLLPLIAASVRRMHDVGQSGWFTLIPIYNIVLYCTPTVVSNSFAETNESMAGLVATAVLQPIPGAERPGRGPTITISILFGPFGAIPANNAAKQARERGYPTQPYWTAFWVSWLASSATVVLVSIAVSLAFLGLIVHGSTNNSAVAVPQATISTDTTSSMSAQISGQVALSAQELRDAVVANHLTVYWVGPMAGAKYSLTGTNPNLIYVKYLPDGVGIDDRTTQFRTVCTYVQKDAFSMAQSGAAVEGNVGFMTQDGNAGFYVDVRSTNVYVGIKGSGIQVEIFDPAAGQAVSLAHDQVSRIE